MIKLELPYPPSINTYYATIRGRRVMSEKGRKYRENIQKLSMGYKIQKYVGIIAVTIHSYPPDNRKRDLDNILKSLLDGLQHAAVYNDDSQIYKLTIMRMIPTPLGKVVVYIYDMFGGYYDNKLERFIGNSLI